MNFEEKVEHLEFQLGLLFENREIDRFIYESNITRKEYLLIMNLLDSIREKLDKGETVGNGYYENEMYKIVPRKYGDYHFCEFIAKGFADEGQWTEVFESLYGEMPKYRGT